MGKMKNGILDAFSGTFGRVVGTADFIQTIHHLLILGFADQTVQMRGSSLHRLSGVFKSSYITGYYSDSGMNRCRIFICVAVNWPVAGYAVFNSHPQDYE
jgi:hypothetical protein